MKKVKMIYLILSICIAGWISGTSNVVKAENYFPEKYSVISESGKIEFNCWLDISKEANKENINELVAIDKQYGDEKKIWSVFGEEKENYERYEYPDEKRAMIYYEFADGNRSCSK